MIKIIFLSPDLRVNKSVEYVVKSLAEYGMQPPKIHYRVHKILASAYLSLFFQQYILVDLC
jgi:hypothetical protein